MTAPAGRTRLPVMHVCGHEVLHDLGGPPRTRKWQAEQRAKGPCPACKTLAWRTEVAIDDATYAMLAAERELPKLEGTDRQVAWAITLRGKLLDALPEKLVELNRIADQRGHPRIVVPEEGIALIIQVVETETSAAWWIRNRTELGKQLVARNRVLFKSGDAGEAARRLLMWAGTR